MKTTGVGMVQAWSRAKESDRCNLLEGSRVIQATRRRHHAPGGAMKTATYLLAVATFLVAPSLSATQSAIVIGIQPSAGELSPEVQLYVGRGDDLSGRRQVKRRRRRGGWMVTCRALGNRGVTVRLTFSV